MPLKPEAPFAHRQGKQIGRSHATRRNEAQTLVGLQGGRQRRPKGVPLGAQPRARNSGGAVGHDAAALHYHETVGIG